MTWPSPWIEAFVANAIGTGIADDKSIYPYVPKMIEFYLGETAILPNVPSYLCMNTADCAYVLANLVPVDYVCLFEEDTPYNLIAEIVPDVLVKGADWSVDAIVGKDVVEKAGGVVATIEFVPDRSTTSIIDRILERFSSK